MPVSLIPLITTVLISIAIAWFVISRSKASFRAFAAAIGFVCLVLGCNFAPGIFYSVAARCGSPSATYKLARWTEKHDERIGEWVLWPVSPNVLGGYTVLERAAAMNYPPAIYALGVRLKHGYFVPEPSNWTGPGGNVFSQPERGQPLIDRAIALGYQPVGEEQRFYWSDYRD